MPVTLHLKITRCDIIFGIIEELCYEIIRNDVFSKLIQTTYPEFHYTSLLYLTDHGKDFQGGQFIFVDDKLNR